MKSVKNISLCFSYFMIFAAEIRGELMFESSSIIKTERGLLLWKKNQLTNAIENRTKKCFYCQYRINLTPKRNPAQIFSVWKSYQNFRIKIKCKKK